MTTQGTLVVGKKALNTKARNMLHMSLKAHGRKYGLSLGNGEFWLKHSRA